MQISNADELRAIKSKYAVLKRLNPDFQVRPLHLVTKQIKGAIQGELKYSNGDDWRSTKGAKIGDGYRRDTTWQVFTDLAMIEGFLQAVGFEYKAEDFDIAVERFAGHIEPNAIKSRSSGKEFFKWSPQYTIEEWQANYRDNPDRQTMRIAYVNNFIGLLELHINRGYTEWREKRNAA